MTAFRSLNGFPGKQQHLPIDSSKLNTFQFPFKFLHSHSVSSFNMFAQKTAVLLAVLATVAPVLGYNPYVEENGLYAREDFDDLYIREVDDFDFEMQKREVIDNYLSARDDLESLLYARSKLQDERAAVKDQHQTHKAKSTEQKLHHKEKAEEKALKKTEKSAKKEKGAIKKDEHKDKAAQRKLGKDFNGNSGKTAQGGKASGGGKTVAKKEKRSFFDDIQIEW